MSAGEGGASAIEAREDDTSEADRPVVLSVELSAAAAEGAAGRPNSE
jgi:hypothetical protein